MGHIWLLARSVAGALASLKHPLPRGGRGSDPIVAIIQGDTTCAAWRLGAGYSDFCASGHGLPFCRGACSERVSGHWTVRAAGE
jgi:hypothetical protein